MSEPAEIRLIFWLIKTREVARQGLAAAIGNGRQPAAPAVLALARREYHVATMSPLR